MLSDKSPVMDAPQAAPARKRKPGPVEFVDDRKKPSLRVGIIGYGYWGPNIVRNFHGLESCQVVAICDKSTNALKSAYRAYPGVKMTQDFNDILTSPDIDAVAVITPVWTHFELAKAALENGKHIFVEKPF